LLKYIILKFPETAKEMVFFRGLLMILKSLWDAIHTRAMLDED
jgi:hypothetical protein